MCSVVLLWKIKKVVAYRVFTMFIVNNLKFLQWKIYTNICMYVLPIWNEHEKWKHIMVLTICLHLLIVHCTYIFAAFLLMWRSAFEYVLISRWKKNDKCGLLTLNITTIFFISKVICCLNTFQFFNDIWSKTLVKHNYLFFLLFFTFKM